MVLQRVGLALPGDDRIQLQYSLGQQMRHRLGNFRTGRCSVSLKLALSSR